MNSTDVTLPCFAAICLSAKICLLGNVVHWRAHGAIAFPQPIWSYALVAGGIACDVTVVLDLSLSASAALCRWRAVGLTLSVTLLIAPLVLRTLAVRHIFARPTSGVWGT